MRGKTALVAGAYGFLASGLVEALLEAGARVIAVGRDPAKSRFGDRVRSIKADVSDPFPVEGSVDFVVHAASPATPKVYAKDPLSVIGPNVFGTRHLLELARAKGARFLFLSSCEVYAQVDPLSPRACYPEAKRMGEALCAAYHRRHGVETVCARLFHTYGPGMALDDGRVFADFVADAVKRRPVSIKSDGLDRRPFCHLDDAVSALMLLLEKGEPGTAYDVANDEAELSVAELAELVARLFPERCRGVERAAPPPGYVPSPVRRYEADVSRLRALGWAPRVSPEEGFRRTVESYL